MPKRSAGLLIYRRTDPIEVLLVHPGGPFWANKDDGSWSIPKGELDEIEAGLDAAKRELTEETGLVVDGEFTPLEPIRQRGGKIVHAWAVEADVDISSIRSNTFALEWPPRSGQIREFPEVDRVAWFDLSKARVKILASQVGLLDQLSALIV